MKDPKSGLTKKEILAYFPEAAQVLESFGHGVNAPPKPLKFYQRVEIVPCPAAFNPSSQGDFAFTKSFHVSKGGKLGAEFMTQGPSYSYDTMLSTGVNPYERTVDVPKGERAWVVTYDGQWGGYWSRVYVFIHPNDALPEAKIRADLSLVMYDKKEM